ncbi:hypothetical protein FB451DRAFT_1180820 [Mycena latifolia]|nr:hypothetical protein FB451DRAFT_1180820 [Mycena latifolia]
MPGIAPPRLSRTCQELTLQAFVLAASPSEFGADGELWKWVHRFLNRALQLTFFRDSAALRPVHFARAIELGCTNLRQRDYPALVALLRARREPLPILDFVTVDLKTKSESRNLQREPRDSTADELRALAADPSTTLLPPRRCFDSLA